MSVGIIGLGFVGSAIMAYFKTDIVFDKFKDGGIGSLKCCLNAKFLFICLPTLYNIQTQEYDIESINETLYMLNEYMYDGYVLIKSTLEPTRTESFAEKYSHLKIIHNPEFLSARTAVDDYKNQKTIILGYTATITPHDKDQITGFFKNKFPCAQVIECSSNESECTKIFCNSFYAAKIQIFNEFYDLCITQDIDFENVKSSMLSLGWINPMHTDVPGSDGKLSFGGACFPKDISALVSYMDKYGICNSVLKAALDERNNMRESINNSNILETTYKTKFGNNIDQIKTLGWGSIKSQEIRFKILLEIYGFDKSDSILDVGCGYGDLSKFVENYTGIDIRKSAISNAIDMYPSINVSCATVFDITRKFDWVFASGVFSFFDKNWDINTKTVVMRMFDICKKGVAFNMLSNLTPFSRDSDMKYVDIAEILVWLPEITHNFSIRHDYLKNDFTVYLYKENA